MSSEPVKVGIIGLGRWARVLTRAAKKSEKFEIVAGFSRSEEKRLAFEKECGIPSAARHGRVAGEPRDQGRDSDGTQRTAPARCRAGCQGRKAHLYRKADREYAGKWPADRGAAEPIRHPGHGWPQRAAAQGNAHDQGCDQQWGAGPRVVDRGKLLQ